ncbi:hypothetical protein GDO81_020180 [Engystomops pustulosus]|uniref:EGF-like domain-containing protein n=1 Tax=Engystomops pustulosus TaxID=76066 RepID=A0AAV6ZA68_ENGPU|nr:hypothetical protein GDO81_020180 [Engystomops pustulosus]
MTQVPQFTGDLCFDLDRQEESCSTSMVCRNKKNCEGFTCEESGKCIILRLKCNGDDDCGDRSDEKDCKVIRKTCTDEMEQYWAIENLAAGLNVFTNNREGIVLDHRYYAGGCSPHYILGTRFRKPYNVESYLPETKGKYEFSLSEYESYSDYSRNVSKFYSQERSFSIGFKIPAVFEFGLSYSDQKFKTYKERTMKFSHKGGIIGGFPVTMTSPAGYMMSDVASCMQAGFNLGGNICGVWVGVGMTDSECEKLLNEIGDKQSNRYVVEDFVALVRGGASEHIAALAYKNLPTPNLMQEWGDAVLYNPEIISIKASPLYELVTAADFIGAITLQDNLKRALEEYERETSACRCAPCRNNGVPVFKESRCECVCPLGFRGSACEISARPAPIIDGGWSCWSSWTPCSGRVQSRQRQCNNPSPDRGGQPCEGAASDTRSC